MRKRILYLFLVFGLLLPAASDVQGRAATFAVAEQKDATVYITNWGEVPQGRMPVSEQKPD
ncbi:hypothetical protein GCM10007415_34520 [Parapedobacter pyrenivorans]|uniref:Uncharacterized protein n=1 Tax=Parapedobacter pyrenivorans TaxID=1305674 RepID=A0A917HYU3_9SPHI|nr:hypothetical protein [Parapedobacter pyrenivorans]GGG96419.1 hypothetical protein GCM10007415_34520 [Parapedobacter pyrenivorans]